LPAPVFVAAVFRAPQTRTEKIVAGVFAEVLGVERVGLDDDFFALGGDSTGSIQLVSMCEARGVRFSVREVFECRTVGRLAEVTEMPAHARHVSEVHASDLTLDKFIDAQTLATAPMLPHPSAEVRTVLLTGATGFLGRFLALEWLERLAPVDGKLICLVRAETNEDARRLAAVIPSCRRTTASWPPNIWRSSSATRAKPTLVWINRPGSGWPTPSI
jgi:acyl carrier protein